MVYFSYKHLSMKLLPEEEKIKLLHWKYIVLLFTLFPYGHNSNCEAWLEDAFIYLICL